MSKIRHERLGSSDPFLVQIFDGDTDLAISINGSSVRSANATNPETGTVVDFVNVTEEDGANGIFKLTRATGTFTEAGVYDILITYTDNAGDVQKYPREEGALKVKFS